MGYVDGQRYWVLTEPEPGNRISEISEAAGCPFAALVDDDAGCILYGAVEFVELAMDAMNAMNALHEDDTLIESENTQ